MRVRVRVRVSVRATAVIRLKRSAVMPETVPSPTYRGSEARRRRAGHAAGVSACPTPRSSWEVTAATTALTTMPEIEVRDLTSSSAESRRASSDAAATWSGLGLGLELG